MTDKEPSISLNSDDSNHQNPQITNNTPNHPHTHVRVSDQDHDVDDAYDDDADDNLE